MLKRPAGCDFGVQGCPSAHCDWALSSAGGSVAASGNGAASLGSRVQSPFARGSGSAHSGNAFTPPPGHQQSIAEQGSGSFSGSVGGLVGGGRDTPQRSVVGFSQERGGGG